jgi:two-component system, NtrC family, sensor kinase
VLPSLRRELIGALAIVFAGALFVAVAGVAIMLPRIDDPRHAAAFVVVLLLLDLLIFAWFGHNVLRWRVLAPLERMLAGVEAIAEGSFDARLPEGESQEVARLAGAVNRMAERLLADQQTLAANIRSLDETNQMLTEARDVMVRAEKMASVGRLSAGIAHEVGNPLAAVINYLGILGRTAGPRETELLEAAEREARRIDRIVRGLLDYSRPREARLESVSVTDVVRETLELVRMQGHFATVEVEVDMAGELPPVEGDPFQLQQVLVNLLVNAADAIGEARSGRIQVRTSFRPVKRPQQVPVRRRDDPVGVDYSHRRRLFASGRFPRHDPAAVSGSVVEIEVRDDGPGIPAELLEQIFEPFVTTKEPGKGTGLGLAVCARIIDDMGGSIRAENAPDGGAVFHIILPALAATPVEVQ